MLAITSARKKITRAKVMKQVTVRDFDGGLNVLDNELNMSSKFARRLDNLVRAPDGSLQLRYGTKLFADLGEYTDLIVNTRYYNGYIIAVAQEGNVFAVDGAGTIYLIWSEAIARSRNGQPAGWSTVDFASFSEFKGDLRIANGVDKPIIVNSNLYTTYLQDLGTGSNLNTPIGRYMQTHDEYSIIGGDPLLPATLHISNRATGGTYYGDAAPNDAIQFDLGPWVTQGNPEMTGIGSFRDKLVVTFPEVIILMSLGTYSDAATPVHLPSVDDVIANYGAISHRTIQALGEDMLLMDIIGVPSIRRALLTNNISPVRESQLVDPDIQQALAGLSQATLQDHCFAVHNRRAYETMFFIPNANTYAATTETMAYVYKLIAPLKIRAWFRFRGWNMCSGCTSAEGRVFLSSGAEIYVYGNSLSEEQYDADFIGHEEAYSDGTVHTDGRGFTPVATLNDDGSVRSVSLSGIPISFDWQMPWADLEKRTQTKHTRYLAVETTGRGAFTTQMFIDNIARPRPFLGEAFGDDTLFTDGYGFTPGTEDYDPALEMNMVGGDRGGFGIEPFAENFGGGRISSDERLYRWPSKNKIFKLRFFGNTRGPLSFISVSMYYQEGNIRR